MRENDPRLILICCEGTTEELYFNAVIDARRIPGALVPPAESFNGSKHKALIDICAQKRANTSSDPKYDIPEDEIEVWAVFDKDDWSHGFTSLERYAANKNIRLAYSDPQFETYLLQHLSQDGSRKCGDELEHYLAQKMDDAGHGSAYDKSNLDWLKKLIDDRPRTLEMAIANANLRSNRTRSPFLTTHKLTERLLEFEPK